MGKSSKFKFKSVDLVTRRSIVSFRGIKEGDLGIIISVKSDDSLIYNEHYINVLWYDGTISTHFTNSLKLLQRNQYGKIL